MSRFVANLVRRGAGMTGEPPSALPHAGADSRLVSGLPLAAGSTDWTGLTEATFEIGHEPGSIGAEMADPSGDAAGPAPAGINAPPDPETARPLAQPANERDSNALSGIDIQPARQHRVGESSLEVEPVMPRARRLAAAEDLSSGARRIEPAGSRPQTQRGTPVPGSGENQLEPPGPPGRNLVPSPATESTALEAGVRAPEVKTGSPAPTRRVTFSAWSDARLEPQPGDSAVEPAEHQIETRMSESPKPAHRRDFALEPAQRASEVFIPPARRSDTHSSVEEPLRIEVRIGRVEVRLAKPAPPQARPAAERRGFEDFSLARNYLGRNWF